ncbi:MAG: ABC transporter ATP-binding protein/permease [Alphaproteobacteria bacterium]|nr:ABC transporter ATP-binding protein/permease [Alphaproteobacteria bacterium]
MEAREPSGQRQPSPAGFRRRFLALAGGYWFGERKWSVRFLTLALVGLTVGQVVVPILVNLWSKRLFDALEQRSMDQFVVIVGLLGGIIVFNIANTTFHLRVKRQLQWGWRQWLTQEILGTWLTRGRHHQITNLPGDHDNPDGRIAEDIRITTEYAIDLGHSLSYCAMLLISFTNILWRLSGAPEVTLGGISFTVPGYLLYIAVVYAAAGTSLAVLLGKPLVTAVNRRQGVEADFRVGLVRVRENAQAIALMHTESEERRSLLGLLRGVRAGWNGQTRTLSNVTIFSSFYSVLSSTFPILLAAPQYISGAISLGALMQTAQAFQQTVAALSWPIDNLGRAAEWKASVERVLGLYDALHTLQHQTSGAAGQGRIVVVHSDTARSLSFQDLAVTEPDGTQVIASFDAEIRPGERVLIVGDPGAAIRLFRAVARVWPWGSGRIELPAHTRVFFMPQRPYLPRGFLRDAMCYPGAPEMMDCEQGRAALERVGLQHLIRRFDETETWKEVLAMAEQQRLGFARLLLRRPDWIFVENATDALDPAGEEAMLRLLDEEFPAATLVTIGTHAGLEAHHGRKFTLRRTGSGVEMTEGTSSH